MLFQFLTVLLGGGGGGGGCRCGPWHSSGERVVVPHSPVLGRKGVRQSPTVPGEIVVSPGTVPRQRFVVPGGTYGKW